MGVLELLSAAARSLNESSDIQSDLYGSPVNGSNLGEPSRLLEWSLCENTTCFSLSVMFETTSGWCGTLTLEAIKSECIRDQSPVTQSWTRVDHNGDLPCR